RPLVRACARVRKWTNGAIPFVQTQPPGSGADELARPARHKRRGRSKDGGQYFPLSYPMARSAAFRSLSGPALKVFIELRTRFNGGNNGDLSVSLKHPDCSESVRALPKGPSRSWLRRASSGHLRALSSRLAMS